MLLVEVGETTLCRQLSDLGLNEECMKTELDMLDELQEKSELKRRNLQAMGRP